MEQTIVGITGTHSAGKGTVVENLKQRGFNHFSAREFLNGECDHRRMERNRDSYNIIANDLRARFGSEYIVYHLFLTAIQRHGSAVIESVYTLAEIEKCRETAKLNNIRFVLLAIDADPKIRYERAKLRQSETDQVTFQEFMDKEQRELESDDPSKHNLRACRAAADYVVENNGTIDDFNAKLEVAFDQLEIK